ncbi:uncharacterized protein J4E92_001740 [Alternaria infectoria]|uniref:uncharacterized protein n=1 Tax=Alternaria infectoria TaxID=45303 RepID=UPI00221E636C|nr:uncharacterized protein J4E92_001740 [Alternaria infectoria]KAI4937015.1 hypothetical protein J4E92_001740 [Alternaria infectoria]
MGSTLNQGNIHAGGNLHFGNVNTFLGNTGEKKPYRDCLHQLLSTLSGDPRDYKDDLITLNGRWLKGTCQWILHTKEFAEWNDSDPPRLLWITGGPGKGKTMLAHFLVEHCETTHAHKPDRQMVIYFFCGAQDGRNSGPSILRGLVYQMLMINEATFRHIQDPFSNHGKSLFEDDRFEALWKVFNSMIRDSTLDSVTCIMDGLDECVEEALTPFLTKIRDVFAPTTPDLSKNQSTKLKGIAISRNYPESFEIFLDTFPRLRIDVSHNVEISKDVGNYIDDRMKLLACAEHKKPKLGQLRSKVRQRLVDGADGSYLWVKFAIKSLESVICPELEEAITEFPRGLDDVYTRILRALPDRQKDKVFEIIRWVTTAYRPLTLLEIGTALELSPADDQDLEDATADFVRCARDLLLVSEAKEVMLVHASFRDFLVQIDDESVPEYLIKPRMSHWKLANRTFEYAADIRARMTRPTTVFPHLVQVRSRRNPLIGYSCQYGFQHLLLGQIKLVRYCLEHRRIDVNVRDVRNRTPIFYAVLSGSAETVKHLLSHGADPNLEDVVGQQPIHIACGLGNPAIVDALLSSKANPNALTIKLPHKPFVHGLIHEKSTTRSNDDSFSADISYDFGEKGLTRMSATNPGTGYKDDDFDRADVTPLHFAAHHGYTRLVGMLLRHGAKPNLKDQLGRTALHCMPMWLWRINEKGQFQGASEGVEMLIKAGTDTLALDLDGNTAFHKIFESPERANFGPRLEVLNTFLRYEFPIDAPTGSSTTGSLGGVTALQLACESSPSDVVIELVKLGADANHQDNHGQTALHHVSNRKTIDDLYMHEVPKVVAYLLAKMSGVAIVARDNDGRSACDVGLETDKVVEDQLERKKGSGRIPYDIDNYEARLKGKKIGTDALKGAIDYIQADWTPDQKSEFLGFVRSLGGGESGEDIASIILRQRREYREAAEAAEAAEA